MNARRRVAAALALSLSFTVVSLGCQRKEPAQPEPRAAASVSASAPSAQGPRELPFGDGRVQFFVPESANGGEKPPFVLVLHGLGGNGSDLVQALGLEAFAAAKQFLFAAPDGTLDAMGRRFWNANDVCCNFSHRDVNDVERLTGLIDYAVGSLGADGKRVFIVGYSNGGFMAHRLACDRSPRVRAIVSLAASGPDSAQRCQPEAAVSVLEVHGDNDRIVPFAGGRLFGNSDMPQSPSVRDGLATWARNAQCQGELAAGERFDFIEELAGADTETFHFASCRTPSPTLWKVNGAGHVIPLGARAISAIWDFLAAQR